MKTELDRTTDCLIDISEDYELGLIDEKTLETLIDALADYQIGAITLKEFNRLFEV